MGRHSAPDDEPDDAAVGTTTTLDLGPPELDVPRGRHAQPGDTTARTDEQPTQMIAPIDPDVTVDDALDTGEFPVPVVEPAPADRKADKAAAKAAQKAEEKARKQAAKSAAAEAKAAAAEAKAAQKAAAKTEAKAEPQTEPKTEPKAESQTEPKTDAKPTRPAEPKTKKKRNGETDTQADLRVLRENSAVRARSIAAVLVSFLLYTIVIIVIGQTSVYLLWIWVPIVLAGVLVGVVLDLAHRPPKGSEPAPPLEPMG